MMDRDIELRLIDVERAKLKLRCFELAKEIIGPEIFVSIDHTQAKVVKIGNDVFESLWK